MKENPPPGAYFDDKNGQTSKGPTFGLSHKYYQKVIIPKEQKGHTSGQTVRSTHYFIKNFHLYATHPNDSLLNYSIKSVL